MAQAKYGFIFNLKEPLKKDKLDQVLLFNFSPVDFLNSKLIEKDEQGKSSFRSRNLETKKNSYTCWMLDWFNANSYKQHMVIVLSDKDKLENKVYQALSVNKSEHLIAKFLVIFEKNNQDSKGQAFSFFHSIKSFANKLSVNEDNKEDKNSTTPKIEYKPEQAESEDDVQEQTRPSAKGKKLLNNPIELIGNFLNSSKPLQTKDFVRLNQNELFRAENGRVAMLQNEYSQSFKKYLLLTSLSFAYAQALKKATLTLAYQRETKITELEELLTQSMETLEFVKSYYFDYPLNGSHSSLVQVWEEVSYQARLADLYDEFIAKFDLIKQSISFEKMIREIKNSPVDEEKRKIDDQLKLNKITDFNRSVIIFGSLLVLIGLINITPFSINYFFQNWFDVLQNIFSRVG